MATATVGRRAAPVVLEESFASRILRTVTRAPVQVFLILVGILWLVPTIGLFLTSLMPVELIETTGWWTIISTPSRATFENYREVFANDTITGSLLTTLWIAIGGTLLPIFVAALAAYAFAWLEFPGRDWLFVVVIGLLVVPLQMALIPIFSLYSTVGIFDTVIGLVLFHTAFGLPFAIFLLRNFFIGIPKDLLEAARIDGASEVRIFFKLMLLWRCPRSPRSRSSSSSGCGTTSSSRSRSRVRWIRSPSRSSPRCDRSAPAWS